MVRDILNNVPEWALLIVVVGLPAVAVGVFLGLRRRLDSWRTDASSAIVVAVAAMLMTLFALVLAFAAVNLYQGYNDTSANVTNEANALRQIQRDVRVFPRRSATASTRRSSRTSTSSGTSSSPLCTTETRRRCRPASSPRTSSSQRCSRTTR